MEDIDIEALSIEETVEYQEHFGNERLRAARVRVIPNPQSKSAKWELEMRTKGSITQLVRKPRPGYILGEDGCLVAFDETALDGLDLREIHIGDWVEYEELDRMEGRRASRIKPLIQRGQE